MPPVRNEIFRQLNAEEKIIEINVEDLKDRLYCLEIDLSLFETVLEDPGLKPRCELVAHPP